MIYECKKLDLIANLNFYSLTLFSWSIVGGILFWTLVFIFIAAVRLVILMREWLPTKFGPEIETVSMIE